MRWAEAHGIALIEAAHAHEELNYEFSAPVDVFEAIVRHDLVLGFERFPRLSGVYVAEPGAAGVAVNLNHGLARQRYSAAHELAHHRFNHGTTLDLEADPLVGWGNDSEADGRERLAEAFAAWFLMPRKLVRTTLASMGLDAPLTPMDVYQLSLRLGASYLATCRHLVNLKMLSASDSRRWARIAPRALKDALGVSDGFDRRQDVWLLGPGDQDQRYFARPGDRFLIDLPEVPSSGYIWKLSLPDDAAQVLRQELILEGQDDAVGQSCIRRVEVAVALSVELSARLESTAEERIAADVSATKARPWEAESSADDFNVHLDIRPNRRGISAASLQRAA